MYNLFQTQGGISQKKSADGKRGGKITMGSAKCSVCGRSYSESGSFLGGDYGGGAAAIAKMIKKPICPDCKRAQAFGGASAAGSSSSGGPSAIDSAAAGVGAVGKGIGSVLKGTGSLLGGLGKGAGVMADAMKSGLDETKAEFGKTHSAEEEIIAINKKVFSSDPEEYKKEIWALFDKATSKPADPLRDTFVIRAAKKKLIHELDVCKLKNPEMFTQFTQLYEELTKKKKLFGIFG